MEQIDLLLVLAQIGVGFAGFGSLTKTDPEVNSLTLVGASTAFTLVVTSFLDRPAS